MVRVFSFGIGMLFVGLALLGAVLPGLPTTPFVLVAAYFFARSSESWYRWIEEHHVLGPCLESWQKERAIPSGARLLGLTSMVLSSLLLVSTGVPSKADLVVVFVLVASAAFIITRPDSSQKIRERNGFRPEN